MNPIVLLVLVAVVVLVLVVVNTLTRRGGGRASIGYRYGSQRALFTPAERSFLGVLEQAMGETYRIFGKVRLADVINVNTDSHAPLARSRSTGSAASTSTSSSATRPP